MDEVMAERASFLVSLSVGAVIYTVIVVFGAMFFMNKVVVNPIREMTREMKRFNPSENKDYETAGVMDLDIQTNDEISEIYYGIRAIQINIIDYLKEKAKSENEIKNKEQKIDKLSDENKKDALTGAGSKSAYIKKSADLSRKIAREGGPFAILMVDLNNLKNVNDEFGHEAGDIYIKGCCSMISEVFTNSQVYRIGGHEFVAILQGEDYENREACIKAVNEKMSPYSDTLPLPEDYVSVACGLSVYDRNIDTAVADVIKRADEAMYKDKAAKKSHKG
jgi:diguanylate cyclase (GGDEF)-like protein